MGKPLETMLMTARSCAKRGDLDEAERLYRDVLGRFPRNDRARRGLEGLTALRDAPPSALSPDPAAPGASAVSAVSGASVVSAVPGAAAVPPAPAEPVAAQVVPAGEIAPLHRAMGEGRLAEAVRLGEALAARYPGAVAVHDALGRAHVGLGQPDKAIAAFRAGLAAAPDCAEVHFNLACTLQTAGRAEEAVGHFRAAIGARPDYADAYNNLGVLYLELGRAEEALAVLRNAAALRPDNAQPWVNIGNALRCLGQDAGAEASYGQALKLDPRNARASFSLGEMQQEQGRKGEALMNLERAMLFDPKFAPAYHAMAALLLEFDLEDEAVATYRRALEQMPENDTTLSFLLHRLARMGDWEAMAPYRARVPRMGLDGQPVACWGMLSLEDAPDRHRIRSEYAAARHAGAARRALFARPAARPQRLRIGYFSSDFYAHATMFLLQRTIALHDRDRFEIHAFSYGAEDSDECRPLFDRFHDVRRMRAEAIADFARRQGLDVAVDLKGHTKDGRLGIFAHGAAPVQIAYLGYPGTCGASYIDYMVADEIVVPADCRAYYSENMLYLPDCYQANDDRRVAAPGAVRRADMGLPERGFVFCSFNNSYKLEPEEFAVWMRLLQQVEGSVLWLYRPNRWVEGNLRRAAERHGVAGERLVFADPVSPEAHLARHALADLFLDSFNVNAHTTASDALWMGLPVLTRAGRGFAARVAASLLHAVGLPELATASVAAYEATALELATRPERLAAAKARLIANRATSPLFDSARFVRHLEAGYDLAHERFRRGEAPADMRVPA